jgi:hypothetical protein
MSMQAFGWKPLQRGTLQGFVGLNLPSGLTLRDCTVHQQGDKRWVGLPTKPQLDKDGNLRRESDGKLLYTVVVEVASSRRAAFQAQALAAVDQLLAKQGGRQQDAA